MIDKRCYYCCHAFEHSALDLGHVLRWRPRCPRCRTPTRRREREKKYKRPHPIGNLAGPPRQVTEEMKAALAPRISWWIRATQALVAVFAAGPILCIVVVGAPHALAWPLGGWQYLRAEVTIGEPTQPDEPERGDEPGRRPARIVFVDEDGERVEVTHTWSLDEVESVERDAQGLVRIAYCGWIPGPEVVVVRKGRSIRAHHWFSLGFWLFFVVGFGVIALCIRELSQHIRRQARRRVDILARGILEVPEWHVVTTFPWCWIFVIQLRGQPRRLTITDRPGMVPRSGSQILVCYPDDKPRQMFVVSLELLEALHEEHGRSQLEATPQGEGPRGEGAEHGDRGAASGEVHRHEFETMDWWPPAPRRATPEMHEAFHKAYRSDPKEAWGMAAIAVVSAMGGAVALASKAEALNSALGWSALGAAALGVLFVLAVPYFRRQERRKIDDRIRVFEGGAIVEPRSAEYFGSTTRAVWLPGADKISVAVFPERFLPWTVRGVPVVCYDPADPSECTLVPLDVGLLALEAWVGPEAVEEIIRVKDRRWEAEPSEV